MSRERIYLFDTTLRDGAQTTGVDFSLEDKKTLAGLLDRLGIDYVEAAIPAPIPSIPHSCRKANEKGQVHRLRHDQARRPLGLQRPGVAALGDSLRGQGLGLPRPRGFGDEPGGKPRRHPRQRRGRPAEAARHRCMIASISSTATRPTGLRARLCQDRLRGALRCSATPTGAPCRTKFPPSYRRWPGSFPARISASTPMTIAAARSPTRGRRGGRQIQGTLNGLEGNANLVTLIGALKLKDGYGSASRTRP